MRRSHPEKLLIATVGVALVFAAGGACIPEDGLTAESTCEEFLRSEPAARDAAVNAVALDVGNPNAGNPMLRLNIEYLCGQAPQATLGDMLSRAS